MTDFEPDKRHYQLDVVDGVGIVCVHCEKVLEARTSPLNTDELVFGQYRYIRQNLPCLPLEVDTQGTDLPSEDSTPASGDLEAQSGTGEKGRL